MGSPAIVARFEYILDIDYIYGYSADSQDGFFILEDFYWEYSPEKPG